MMYVIMYVLDDPDRLDQVLDAWRKAGVGGATIIESTGIHRWQACRRHIPLRFGFEHLSAQMEQCNYTLLAVVEDEDTVQRCITAVESIVGSLDEPNTGVLAAWPAPIVRGVVKRREEG
jgi:nitrogen regulatory protein PII